MGISQTAQKTALIFVQVVKSTKRIYHKKQAVRNKFSNRLCKIC